MIFETWFLFAIASAFVGGISFFTNKYATTKEHDPELSILYGTIVSFILITGAALFFSDISNLSSFIIILGLVVGVINSIAALLKMTTLQHLDVTIFLPLQKVLGPILILLVGLLIFKESFTLYEWFGMSIGLLVPLILIDKTEHTRQSNLLLAFGFVFFVALLGTLSSSIGKVSVDIAQDAWWVAATTNFGMVLGAIALFVIKNKTIHSCTQVITTNSSANLCLTASIRGVTRIGSSLLFFFALLWGGKFVLVSFINSLYILIPIVLSILIYKEHINIRKSLAIIISLFSLYFFI